MARAVIQLSQPVPSPVTTALQALARVALPTTNPGPTITQPVDVDDMDVSAPENTPSQHSPPTKVVRGHDKTTTRSPTKRRANGPEGASPKDAGKGEKVR
jgi:hypothetical protein